MATCLEHKHIWVAIRKISCAAEILICRGCFQFYDKVAGNLAWPEFLRNAQILCFQVPCYQFKYIQGYLNSNQIPEHEDVQMGMRPHAKRPCEKQ